jgi:hypothetical protein
MEGWPERLILGISESSPEPLSESPSVAIFTIVITASDRVYGNVCPGDAGFDTHLIHPPIGALHILG